VNGVCDYPDADNLNTDQMFAGNLTYKISSAKPEILSRIFLPDSPRVLQSIKSKIYFTG